MTAEDRPDSSDFEAFFEANHAQLFGTLCLVTGSASEAEDLMQEAFLKAWERWDRVKTHPSPPGYLYRTAFNLRRNHLRRAWRAGRRLLAAPRSEDQFAAVEEREALFRGLLRLTPRQREAIVLTELLNMTSEEAARLMRIRSVTVRVLASQGRAALKNLLEVSDG